MQIHGIRFTAIGDEGIFFGVTAAAVSVGTTDVLESC